MEYALTANALTKKYGKFQALHNFSMHVPKGAIYGFIGKNIYRKRSYSLNICLNYGRIDKTYKQNKIPKKYNFRELQISCQVNFAKDQY